MTHTHAHLGMLDRLIPLALAWLLGVPTASAANVELPLSIRTQVLDQALAQVLELRPDRSAVLYEEGPCRYLHAMQPHLESQAGQLRFTSRGAASFGLELLGTCLLAPTWRGSIELVLEPYVDEAWQLRYRVIDSAIYDEEGGKASLISWIWELSKYFLVPRLEGFSFDLAVPRTQIIALLHASIAPETAAQLDTALDTLKVGDVAIREQGLAVPLLLDLPDAVLDAGPPAPQAPLTPQELAAFQQALEPWDAFLVSVIKSAGTDIADTEVRDQLFDLLIASRHQLLPILEGDLPPDTRDPVRALFIDAWQDLRAIIEGAQLRGLMPDRLLQYMTFVNAGDALLALDAAAPGLGMRFSADGLRTLARSLRPAAAEDPLRYDFEVDPTLRELFHFEPEPEASLAPPPPSPPESQSWLDWLITGAHAADALPGIAELGNRLDRWTPSDAELESYRPVVAQLLALTADAALAGAPPDAAYATIYRNLVPATALIESCWRQFTRSGEQVTFLRSQAGSIGLMQINQHVWRGFYNVDKLKWDAAYNAQAGAQILLRYLQQYGMKVASQTGSPEHAPRSAYSVYNAGPRAARRFLKPDAHPRERRVDERLWRLYQGFAAGGSADLTDCRVVTGPDEPLSP